MNLKRILIAGAFAGILVSGLTGCVTVDTEIGHDMMPLEQQYDVYHMEWDLEDISLEPLTNMSAYSSRRVTLGAIRDKDFGLTRKGSTVFLVPCVDSMNFGTDPKVTGFHLSLCRDTVNVINENQHNIIQNVNVYSLDGMGIEVDKLAYLEDLNNAMFDGKERITRGIPVYNGGDSLSVNFSLEFAQSYMDRFLSLAEDNLYQFDTIPEYIKTFPGIYLCTDDPLGYGGRINMFDLALKVEDSYISGNYAELKFNSIYDGERKDTSLIFLLGAIGIPDGSDNLPDQYAFNVTEIVDGKTSGKATDAIYVEGGNGVKPVVSSKEIYAKIKESVDEKNVNHIPDSLVIINKATISMPFEFPGDYRYMNAYPSILNPCCRISGYNDDGDKVYTYANLTDASISDEAHGSVDRSNCRYNSDISFHAQKIFGLRDAADSTYENYNIWFLVTFTEITETSSSSSSTNDYLSQLYYYNYLNQLYGGYGSYGYGGYGGYGYSGYGGYGYNNYYSMMMYSSLYGSSSSTSTESSDELDRDRFYGATLYGPTATQAKPKLTLTFAIPKKAM